MMQCVIVGRRFRLDKTYSGTDAPEPLAAGFELKTAEGDMKYRSGKWFGVTGGKKEG